jgi:hypothetical protein
MAVAGRKPIEDRSQARNRMPQAEGTEWREVVDVPFEAGPPLPPRTQAVSTEDPMFERRVELGLDREWPEWTTRWWDAIRRMPHCALWSPTDWEAAFSVAEAHARFVEGWKGCATGAELRIKEKALGTTHDARRDLRIRYVKPPEAGADLPANVTRGNFGEL